MAPQRNNDRNERHPGHTGTIPKTKVRNNCNVPQEAVTPTRRDMTTNLVSTSLDWVPVSEYNSRSNYNQSRKPVNNTSDHELTDLDNSVAYESGFGRFVPVRPQPRVLPLTVQNRESLTADHNDDGAGSTASGYSQHAYPHSVQNGLNQHSNHAAAAVMIVNPTTPNAVTGNLSQPFNQSSSSRNNLTRTLHPARNTLDAPGSGGVGRPAAKTVNLVSNMYDPAQGSANSNDNHGHRESARALGEAIVAACPDTAAVERRLGQIREYIRVTSSLVDTMRNSEDEAYIEHTKEEYDELVEMVMKLKESENKLVNLIDKDKEPDNIEVPTEEAEETTEPIVPVVLTTSEDTVAKEENVNESVPKNNVDIQTLKKVTNIENEELNKTLHSNIVEESQEKDTTEPVVETSLTDDEKPCPTEKLVSIEENDEGLGLASELEIKELESYPLSDTESGKDQHMNDVLRQNILSCVEKVALINELKSRPSRESEIQDVVVRPMSVQSNASTYSDNELWQNEIKNKMEISSQRLASLKQQQHRLLKYQEEAKQQLVDMNRARQTQEIHPSTSRDNLTNMQMPMQNGDRQSRMYLPNQVGVAATLPHCADPQPACSGNVSNDNESQTHSHDDRFSHRDANVASSEEAVDAGAGSDGETERSRQLAVKLRDLRHKKQHMETLVSEFQKLQMATRLDSSRNNYSSSGEESLDEEPERKCNISGGNIKNEDPFKLMEIKAIKQALQKTKDLMRSVENYEAEHLSGVHEETFQMPSHSNMHDNNSRDNREDSGVESAARASRRYNNQEQLQPSQLANIASLQELAQELRMETEKIMGERARLKDMVSNRESCRKHKKVNEEVGPRAPGPAERRQMELRSLLLEKQKELEALLNKEKVLSVGPEVPNMKSVSRTASIANQSYNSEQEEPVSRSEHIIMDAHNLRENENYRVSCGIRRSGKGRDREVVQHLTLKQRREDTIGGDSGHGSRSLNSLPSHMCSVYVSDSDSASRTKSNQRNRGRRRPPQERQQEELSPSPSNLMNQNVRLDPRLETMVHSVPPVLQNDGLPTPYPPPPPWTHKPNQRSNQFTQNSHSQTMDRILNTPPVTYPPAVPFNMMMPYGMLGGAGCGAACGAGCGAWGAWCWQQLALQQREIHQLREQLNHLEERWQVETASHTLNNQVPPGNRANNYWDNFRSYSRQNLLSGSSKCNESGVTGRAPAPPPPPHPLARRSHNALRPPPPGPATPAPAPPAPGPPPPCEPKRNEDSARHARSNVTLERSMSFSSAPDVLNLNQNAEERPCDHLNINRHDGNPFRNVNIANPIPEIIQSHANNINTTNSKKKSCSKLPAKNSANRRNCALDYSQTSNINIASTSEAPNPNLATNNREVDDKTKVFEILRENVYSEVTALIGVNESHPDFLIQLFRELQLISSEPLRQRVLQSIRNVLAQYQTIIENENNSHSQQQEQIPDTVSTTTNEGNNYHDNNIKDMNSYSSTSHIDNGIVRFLLLKSEDTCTPELIEMLASAIINSTSCRPTPLSKKKLLELLSKYEGARVCNVTNDILESLSLMISVNNDGEESTQHTSELSESSILQDVAGSLNLFSSSETQLHAMNACPYDLGWVHMDAAELAEGGMPAGQGGSGDAAEGRSCSDMVNGELAEADQTCRQDEPALDALPDVVDTEETTPTEAEAEWLGLDRVPTRLHMEESSENQKD